MITKFLIHELYTVLLVNADATCNVLINITTCLLHQADKNSFYTNVIQYNFWLHVITTETIYICTVIQKYALKIYGYQMQHQLSSKCDITVLGCYHQLLPDTHIDDKIIFLYAIN